MELFFAIAFFTFGLILGSFLNVCIYRLPRDLSVVAPRSACPQCGHTIRAYDNIPILSWILLRGRCRDCHARISPRYAAVELLNGVLFLACYAHFGLTLAALKYCVFAFLLLGLIFTDAETRLLPDKLTLPGVALGLLFSLAVPLRDVAFNFVPMLVPLGPLASGRMLSLLDAVLGAIVGAAFVYGSGMVYKLARGVEGMGFGDVKMASLLGAVYGLGMIPVVWVKRTRRRMRRGHEPATTARRRAWSSAWKVYRYYAMPFGVFLGMVAILAVFFGDNVLRWYWQRYL